MSSLRTTQRSRVKTSDAAIPCFLVPLTIQTDRAAMKMTYPDIYKQEELSLLGSQKF